MRELFYSMILLLSAQSFATSLHPETFKKIEPLTTDEIYFAISLTDKYNVPLQISGPCMKVEFNISSVSRGFNPAAWSLDSGRGVTLLEADEIQEAILIFNRLKVVGTIIAGITHQSEVIITGESCGVTRPTWTAKY